VVWKVTPPFAAWLASPATNLFFKSGALSPASAVLELGCGVSALVGLAVGPLVSRYVLSDQPYVARFVEENLRQNLPRHRPRPSGAPSGNRRKGRGHRDNTAAVPPGTGNLYFRPLDWELDTPDSSLAAADGDGGGAAASSFDLVVACDCIYNEALVPSFVQTCADVCRLRSPAGAGGEQQRPCVCVVAQQLRDPDVFGAWLREFCARGFRAWRVPDGELPEALRSSSGFVVHVGILRG
jgi:predicted nicotinamide N-methyase